MRGERFRPAVGMTYYKETPETAADKREHHVHRFPRAVRKILQVIVSYAREETLGKRKPLTVLGHAGKQSTAAFRIPVGRQDSLMDARDSITQRLPPIPVQRREEHAFQLKIPRRN